MAKAVLVMDMPECCNECKLFNTDDEYPEYFCGYGHKEIKQIYRKPDWCPLIPEPSRINVSPENTEAYVDIYADGWNACIDTLEGKKIE